MRNRVVEIANDGRRLSKARGFMVVSFQEEEVRMPLDDIGVVIVSGRGASYTNSLLVSLAERCVPLVICNTRYVPTAWLWPIEGHHTQARCMRAQIDAPKPLCKQIWRDLIRTKISLQSAVADYAGGAGKALLSHSKRVKSGDPENVEAQVARKYWPILFGTEFRRRRSGGKENALLNYGYTVLRAVSARSVVASGLHPSVGIHHSNRYDAMQLADDLMEPFRPMIDAAVVKLVREGRLELCTETKRVLALAVNRDMNTSFGTSPLSTCVLRLAQSVAHSFVSRSLTLELPYKPTHLEIGT